MTGFAGDVQLRPGRRIGVAGCVVVALEFRRVAVGAHPVPVLAQAGPVQRILVGDAIVGIEVKPASATLLLRSRIPCDRQRLHAPVRKSDEILLQRIHAERIENLEVGHLAVLAIRGHEKLPVAPEERRDDAVVGESRIVEVAEHGRIGRVLHGFRVLRGLPCGEFAGVTFAARLGADEARRRGRRDRGCGDDRRGGRRRCAAPPEIRRDTQRQHGERSEDCPATRIRRSSSGLRFLRRLRLRAYGGRRIPAMPLLAHSASETARTTLRKQKCIATS